MRFFARTWARPLLALLLAVLLTGSARAVTITIVNLDGPNEGFNDLTPAAPVGGNPGTTLGAQRLFVFQHAAEIWGSLLPGNVEVRVEANFDPLVPCDATSAVLGSAGPIEVFSDFTGAEFTYTWYHAALANKRAAVDLSPGVNDIRARFNSSVDNGTCLGGSNWYYGIDGDEGIHVELLPVVLHELGHGLGFSTLVNKITGAEFFDQTDLYERFVFDNASGLHWNQMNNAQRAASAVNSGRVAWSGPAAGKRANLFLGPRPTVRVNSPGSIAGELEFGTAVFGPPLSMPGVTGNVVLVDDGLGPPSDACSAIVNGAQVAGNIALIDRGGCTFVSKAERAEAVGAIAVVIVNNIGGSPPLMGGEDPGIGIPLVSITLDAGNAIKAALPGVHMTVGLDPARRLGTDIAGRPLLYAPNPVQSGSSISHWDVSASPNLLMEPFINDELSSDVDLTRYHFEDLGWFPHLTAVTHSQAAAVRLRKNSPNPFVSSTTIRFELDREEEAVLRIFDLHGRLVKELARSSLPPGIHTVAWDGTDRGGRRVAPGIYLYRLDAAGAQRALRMVLLE